MTALQLLTYAGMCFVLFASPGPGVATIVARTVQRGPLAGGSYGGGVFVGDMIILAVVVAGLAEAAQSLPGLFLCAKGLALAFFGYNGLKGLHGVVFQPRNALTAARKGITRLGLASGIMAGIATPFGNPKALVFYIGLVPAVFDVTEIGWRGYIAMISVMIPLAILVTGGYVFIGEWIAKSPLGQRAMRYLQGASAILMLAIAGLLVWSLWQDIQTLFLRTG